MHGEYRSEHKCIRQDLVVTVYDYRKWKTQRRRWTLCLRSWWWAAIRESSCTPISTSTCSARSPRIFMGRKTQVSLRSTEQGLSCRVLFFHQYMRVCVGAWMFLSLMNDSVTDEYMCANLHLRFEVPVTRNPRRCPSIVGRVGKFLKYSKGAVQNFKKNYMKKFRH